WRARRRRLQPREDALWPRPGARRRGRQARSRGARRARRRGGDRGPGRARRDRPLERRDLPADLAPPDRHPARRRPGTADRLPAADRCRRAAAGERAPAPCRGLAALAQRRSAPALALLRAWAEAVSAVAAAGAIG